MKRRDTNKRWLAPFPFAACADGGYLSKVLRSSLAKGVLMFGLAVACASENPTLDRRGGPLPDDGGAPASGGADGATQLVPFCDALTVVRAKCQRCHNMPPKNGAPVPFLTYEDLIAPYGDGSTT